MKKAVAGLVLVGALLAPPAMAYQEVIIQGTVWACENECGVIVYPGGAGFYIWDLHGGLVYIVPR